MKGEPPCGAALLTVAEMGRADALTIAGGVPGIDLMEAAGAAVTREMATRWTLRPVLVLCGPGNNGGDGFVAARRLAAAGWPVRLALLGPREALKGDAAIAAARWAGPVEPADPAGLDGAALVIDALFGAGLSRPLDGKARALVEALAARKASARKETVPGLSVIAVDVPSGVHGDTGAVLGAAAPADLTVTFFRRKPGHLLLPGRLLAGEIVVADIGIPERVLDPIKPTCFANGPDLWLGRLPRPTLDGHKYARGHVLILGGGRMTGAGRLAARAALRGGAGLVSIACPTPAFPIYAASLPSAIVQPLDRPEDFAGLLADSRRNAVLLGPGSEPDAATRQRVVEALEAGRAAVLDAGALTAFAGQADALAALLAPEDRGRHCLLTPHEGEFARLFGTVAGDKLARAREGARRAGAVVLLKGGDTVIAAPDGRAAINANAPADLATAGAGDVLAGLCVGLMAQRLDGFEAGCIGAWLHGAAAARFGPGLIAEDIAEHLPPVLAGLRAMQGG